MLRPRIVPLAARQLEREASPENLRAAAIAVRVAGTRADVRMLERYAPRDDAAAARAARVMALDQPAFQVTE